MSKKAKQWRSLSEEQLWRLVGQGTYPGAQKALERVKEIKESGHTPTIYYSDFNGFRVINEDDPEQFRLGLHLRSTARPFRI